MFTSSKVHLVERFKLCIILSLIWTAEPKQLHLAWDTVVIGFEMWLSLICSLTGHWRWIAGIFNKVTIKVHIFFQCIMLTMPLFQAWLTSLGSGYHIYVITSSNRQQEYFEIQAKQEQCFHWLLWLELINYLMMSFIKENVCPHV